MHSTKGSLRSARRHQCRTQLQVELLESRVVPYAVSGNAWIHPELVTLSFVPDGTLVSGGVYGYQYSNLFEKFDAKWSTETWQAEFLEAAQVWAQYANLNFSVVDDDGVSLGGGDYQQGDPEHGDIRIGGYSMYPTYLAVAFMPPPVNNYDIAGDVLMNTSKPFNINTHYDLFTVAAHEMGHSLGLNHSTSYYAEMFPYYTGIKPALNADDIAGIQAIYGARSNDSFDASASNGSFGTASDITSSISTGDHTALLADLDITSTSDVDFYKFTAPTGSSSTLEVVVQSSGLSLLKPTMTVYASDMTTVLGTATGTGLTGSTLTVTVNNVSANDQFYVKVDGADNTAFGTGAYALTLNLGTGDSPTVTPPDTQELNGNPLHGGGGSPLTVPGVEHDHDHDHDPEVSIVVASSTVSESATPVTSVANSGSIAAAFLLPAGKTAQSAPISRSQVGGQATTANSSVDTQSIIPQAERFSVQGTGSEKQFFLDRPVAGAQGDSSNEVSEQSTTESVPATDTESLLEGTDTEVIDELFGEAQSSESDTESDDLPPVIAESSLGFAILGAFGIGALHRRKDERKKHNLHR